MSHPIHGLPPRPHTVNESRSSSVPTLPPKPNTNGSSSNDPSLSAIPILDSPGTSVVPITPLDSTLISSNHSISKPSSINEERSFLSSSSANTTPSSSSLKRKKSELDHPARTSMGTTSTIHGIKQTIKSDGNQAGRQPIPILPTPLPSKRFRKNPLKRATLFPLEQIPTFPLPPLPPIEDPVLLKQVFTHLSLFKSVKGKFEDPEDDQPKHYEKLEHVGDSLLGMVVTTWLHDLKPGLTPGTATQLKAHLVSNATLSHLSGLYNMPQRLNADPNLLPLLRASTDVRAALMEAYIAAIYVSHAVEDRFNVALPIIDAWLREMYEPLYDFFYTYMKREHDQHSNAVGADEDGSVIVMDEDEIARIDGLARGMFLLVKMHCEAYERNLKWEEGRYETSIGTLYKMRIMVDGMELGEATRAGKIQAKDVAAWEAAKKLGLATA